VVAQRDCSVVASAHSLGNHVTFSPCCRLRRSMTRVAVVRLPTPLGCESVVAQRDYFVVASAHSLGVLRVVFSPQTTKRQQLQFSVEVKASNECCRSTTDCLTHLVKVVLSRNLRDYFVLFCRMKLKK
jgi:hypothetical protein